jgi:hypothetical protein
LWDWIDGLCTADEAAAVQELVATQPEWKEKHREFMAIHQSLKSDIELMQPSMRFTKNVMEQIAAISIKTTTRSYLNNKIVYGIGGLFVAMLSAVILYAIAMVDWAAGGSSFKMPSSQIDTINWGGLLQGPAGTAAVIIFSVLTMAFLDQYLRPKLLKR